MTQEPPPLPEEAIEQAVKSDILADIKSNLDPEKTPEPLIFFCKDCNKIIQKPKRIPRQRFTFICPECNEKSVAWGTKKSIYNFFHITEKGEVERRTERSKGTQVAKVKEAKALSRQKTTKKPNQSKS